MAEVKDEAAHRYAREVIARFNHEYCTCTHKRADHEDTLAWGHGDCLIEDCTCMKFTWTEFRTSTPTDIK